MCLSSFLIYLSINPCKELIPVNINTLANSKSREVTTFH